MRYGLRGVAVLCGLLSALALAAEPDKKQELAQIRSQLAVEYARVGNLKVALESAAQAVQADDSYAPAFIAQAYILALLQQNEQAEQSYRRALQLAPDSPEANNNYGLFLCERQRLEEALPHFQRALANPLYDSPQTAYLNLGHCHARLGNFTQANDYLLLALRAQPNFVPALQELTTLHLQQGNAKLAAFYFDRMRKIMADALSVDALWLGVQVARATKDRAAERKYAATLKEHYPDSKETQLLLGGS